MDRATFLELTGRYADGAADANDVAALEEAMHRDPELRKLFLQYLRLDTALGAAAGGLRALPPPTARSRLWQKWTAAAAIAAVVLFILFGPKTAPPPARPAEPIATLVAATDAVWADSNVELTLRGGDTPDGPARLESGMAEFRFVDGATAILRGPAKVRFLERKRLFVGEGSVFLRCPTPESRLTVVTPETEVIDLGTEFAVEARKDKSTRVAVLSGEVKVMSQQPRLLRKGEAVEVRSDGILSIRPLAWEDFSQMLLASPLADEALQRGRNLLAEPGFETRGTAWNGTEPHLVMPAPGGRTGMAARISAKGHRFWPQCRQQLDTGDIAGRLVLGSVWAASAPDDPLRGGQCAMLKIVFVNAEGREFAYAMQRFLPAATARPGQYTQAQVAAFVPPGTRGVQVQLMLNAHALAAGSVLFDDATLMVLDAPVAPPQ